jgi:hypothetical protein
MSPRGLSVANALFGLLVLKESLPPERRRKFEWRRANPLGGLKALSHYPALTLLFGMLVLGQLAHDSLPTTWSYYTMLKFGWGPGDVGLSLVAIGILTAISFAVLPRVLTPRIGQAKSVYLGLFCGALAYAGYAISSQPWMFYAWMIVFTFGGVANPAMTAILTEQVPADQQGEVAGRDRQHHQPDIDRSAADDDKPARLVQRPQRAGLFSRRGLPGGGILRSRWSCAVFSGPAAGPAQLTAALSRSSSSLIRSFCFFRAATRISSQSGLAISLSIMSWIFLC